jgi:hypothetical protein
MWNGAMWADWDPPSGRASFRDGVWYISINRSDLGGTWAFDFTLYSFKAADLQIVGMDLFYGSYQLTPPPPPPPPPPAPAPAKTMADAPYLPKRVQYVGTSIRHLKAASAIYSTMRGVGLGRKLQVACWSNGDWRSVLADLGDSPTGRVVIMGFWHPAQLRFLHLAPKVCEGIQALITTGRGNASRASASVVALHETAHMYGYRNEAQASCYAVQLVYDFARVLRLSPSQALSLERQAVRTTRRTAPRGYWDSLRCQDGGAWDLDDESRNLNY